MRNYLRSYLWEAYPRCGTCEDLWEAPLMAETELKLVFPQLAQSLNMTVEIIFCLSLSCRELPRHFWHCALLLSTDHHQLRKPKCLQEKEHGYSRKKLSVTAGKGQVNKPLQSFTEMLSSQGTDCSNCWRGRLGPLHGLSHQGQPTDEIFSGPSWCNAQHHRPGRSVLPTCCLWFKMVKSLALVLLKTRPVCLLVNFPLN